MASDTSRGKTIRYAIEETWLGTMILAATERGVCWLAFGEDTSNLEQQLLGEFANATILEPDTRFQALVQRTIDNFGARAAHELPIDIRGTPFQAKVWQALRDIPFGSTVSYGELAHRIGQPTASRAVATACGRNEIAVLIPCHRVVGKDGSLTGYRWGVERKRRLLAQEAGNA